MDNYHKLSSIINIQNKLLNQGKEMTMFKRIRTLLIITISFSIVSAQPILPVQTNTIKALANENGFSNESLDQYLMKHY